MFHFFGLSSPDCIGFGAYWPVCFIFFWAVQPRLYRFWCLLACVFHFFGLSSPDCIGFGVYWPVCFVFFLGLSSPDCIGFGVYWPVRFIFFLGLSSQYGAETRKLGKKTKKTQ